MRSPVASTPVRVWIALHALVVLAPVLAMLVPLPDVPLYGVEESSRPRWAFGAWRAETFQSALRDWFESHIGFRGVMVRTDSTVCAVLGSDKQRQTVLVGSDDATLYVRDSLLFMAIQRRELPSFVASAESFAVHLGSVRRKLHDRGRELVVVVAPNKTMLYDENVPARYRGRERVDLQVHEALRAALERAGVPFADANALFESQRADVDRLFPRTARHWSRLGACLVLREALPVNLARPDCSYDVVPISREMSPDFDLYRLQNQWRVETGPVLNTVIRRSDNLGTDRKRIPRALYVGTSFMWTFGELMRHDVDNAVALYYNRSFYDVTSNARDPLPPAEPGSPRWADYALGRDLYVIEILEEYLRDGYVLPFLKTLDEHLE